MPQFRPHLGRATTRNARKLLMGLTHHPGRFSQLAQKCGLTTGAALASGEFISPVSHASIQQTQRYLNVTDEELRKGLEVSWKNQGRPLRLASGH